MEIVSVREREGSNAKITTGGRSQVAKEPISDERTMPILQVRDERMTMTKERNSLVALVTSSFEIETFKYM